MRNVSLQKRHFEYLADTLLAFKSAISDEDHKKLVEHFCYALRCTNYQFKTDRFYDRARGVKPAPRTRTRKTKLGAAIASIEVDADSASYWE